MAVREKLTQTTDLGYYEGEIPLSYRYTKGLAGDGFFKGLMKGKITASVAKESGTVYCPPRIFCEDSFEEIDEIIELSGLGIVESFTVCFEDLHGDHMEPVVIGLITLEGASTMLPAKIICDPEEVFIGMPVKAEFVAEADREGTLNDVTFVPCS